MNEARNVTVPDFSMHKEDLRLTYRLIVRAATGKDPEPKDEKTEDKKPLDQVEEVRRLSQIISIPYRQTIGDQIPDIFLNNDTGLYQYLSGQTVPGCRYDGNGAWRPVPDSDYTLRQVEQESYIRNAIIPAIAGMIIEQLDALELHPIEAMKPGIVHALIDVCAQASTIAPDKLKEREASVHGRLNRLLDEARLNNQ